MKQKNLASALVWFLEKHQKSVYLFVAGKSLQPRNVQSKCGQIDGIEVVDVYERVCKAGLDIC